MKTQLIQYSTAVTPTESEGTIESEGTAIAVVDCECGGEIKGSRRQCVSCQKIGVVSLCGTGTEEVMIWFLCMGSLVTKPFAALMCHGCGCYIDMDDRRCLYCGMYCSVRLVESEASSWSVMGYLSSEPIYNSLGVIVRTRENTESPYEISKHLGWLYRADWSVLVRHGDRIFVGWRNPKNASQIKRITALFCPLCGTPVIDRDLVCLGCKACIVDVGIKTQKEYTPSGRYVKTRVGVEYVLRSPDRAQRPAGLLPKVGEGWEMSSPPPQQNEAERGQHRALPHRFRAPTPPQPNEVVRGEEISIDDIIERHK